METYRMLKTEITFEVGTGFAPCPRCGWLAGAGLTEAELWRHFVDQQDAVERVAEAAKEVAALDAAITGIDITPSVKSAICRLNRHNNHHRASSWRSTLSPE
jgi:hypothetical protein